MVKILVTKKTLCNLAKRFFLLYCIDFSQFLERSEEKFAEKSYLGKFFIVFAMLTPQWRFELRLKVTTAKIIKNCAC